MILTVTLEKIRLRAFHGVMPQEQTVGNIFEVTIRISYEATNLSLISDNLKQIINYADLCSIVREQMNQPSQLIENVAYRIMTEIQIHFPIVISGEVTVAKLTPPLGVQLASASVTLKW